MVPEASEQAKCIAAASVVWERARESRSRWVEYSKAKDKICTHTDIKHAPWYVVDAEDKPRAHLKSFRANRIALVCGGRAGPRLEFQPATPRL